MQERDDARSLNADERSMEFAIKSGDLQEVERLLRCGVGVNQCFVKSRGTFSLLYVASEYGWVNIGKLLLKRGALMQAMAVDGCNCVVNASRWADMDVFSRALFDVVPDVVPM
jgi:hypothetical protein